MLIKSAVSEYKKNWVNEFLIKIVKWSIINSCVEVGSDDDDDEDENGEENLEGEEDCEDCDEDDSEVEDEEVTFKWPELVQLYLLSSED